MTDRTTIAVSRLWGSLRDGHLHSSPAFAAELAAQCNGDLSVCTPSISKWSFGQQLEHLYLASHWVLDRLEESLVGVDTSKRMGIYGYGLMVFGFIPRGVFPTIPPLKPASGTLDHIVPLREALTHRLRNVEWDLDNIKACRGKSLHPKMKYLSASQWLFFADIHHRHHLAIMRDILKTASEPAMQRAA